MTLALTNATGQGKYLLRINIFLRVPFLLSVPTRQVSPVLRRNEGRTQTDTILDMMSYSGLTNSPKSQHVRERLSAFSPGIALARPKYHEK